MIRTKVDYEEKRVYPIRAIRSKDVKYILNLMPERPYAQFNAYKEMQYPTLALLNAMYLRGELTPVQAAFMAPTKPVEELYDLKNDPYETINLAADPKWFAIKAEMRTALDAWRKSVNDQGVTEEFRQGGWPATYPTKTLEQWEAIVEKWKPWVFRNPTEKGKHPRAFITQTAMAEKGR